VKGHDFYKATAGQLFGVPVEEVTYEQRSSAKICVLAALYGSGPGTIMWQAGLDWNTAKGILERFFQVYSCIRPFHEKLMDIARTTGYVSTLGGRRRKIDQTDPPYTIVINTPIQGSAADILKVAMQRLSVYTLNTGIQMVISIHDEIVFLVPDDDMWRVQELANIMEAAGQEWVSVPLWVDVAVGPNWQDMQDYTIEHLPVPQGLELL
jgi:DNA polymerase-1